MPQLTASEASNDEMERQRFESWIMSQPHAEDDDISRKSNGEYFHLSTHWCWKSWQAALKSKQGEV